MFDFTGGRKRESLSMPGCFAEATLDDIRRYPWPDPADFDYTELLREIRAHGDKAVFSGNLGTFFHDMCDFFGMEEYLSGCIPIRRSSMPLPTALSIFM